MLPAGRISRLDVAIAPPDGQPGVDPAGELLRGSNYTFRYATEDPDQPAVSLLMRPTAATIFEDADLFPSMDMNLPEGFLFHRILELFPKQKLTKMHLLALMGNNGIGRVGFFLPGQRPQPARIVPRADLLRSPSSREFFDELVRAYLSTGVGISGMQPKIMVPSRLSLPAPDLIVKSAGSDYPGLAANEFMCLRAAALAGIATPGFELSDDGNLLVIDRFDIGADGTRQGFEDVAALMGLRVFERLSVRKYHGSYEAVAEAISLVSSEPTADLHAFFAQLVLCVMVHNGDAHLKNFGMLYGGAGDKTVRLSPMFDIVTTTIYTYERPGGALDVDRTMALKLRRGKHGSRAYPARDELIAFGREICRVHRPAQVIAEVAQGMSQSLAEARRDARIPKPLVERMAAQWEAGLAMASQPDWPPAKAARARRPVA
jgi:serine/threonine-protein kinase HipA